MEPEDLLPLLQRCHLILMTLSFFLPCSGKGTGLGGLSNSQSVSFRQGTNVEFGTPAFATNGPQDIVVNITPI